MNDLFPALKILRRRPLGPLLVISQTGLIITILTFMYFSLLHLSKVVWRDSGIAEAELGVIKILLQQPQANAETTIKSDLRYLNELQDITMAAPIIKAPFDPWPHLKFLSVEPENPSTQQVFTHIIYTNHLGLPTLGATITHGRNFKEADVSYADAYPEAGELAIIISEDVSQLLFPDTNPLGQYLFSDTLAYKIIGISSNIIATSRSGPHANMSALVPFINFSEEMSYMVRTENKMQLTELQDYRESLQEQNRDRVISDLKTITDLKNESQSSIQFSLQLIVLLFIVLILICALGILGLTSFRVATSRRHIAIRRALGATRWQICRYFLSENVIIFCLALAYGATLIPALSAVLNKLGNNIVIPLYSAAISGGLILVVVLAASVYPVLQASRITPANLSGKLAAKR